MRDRPEGEDGGLGWARSSPSAERRTAPGLHRPGAARRRLTAALPGGRPPFAAIRGRAPAPPVRAYQLVGTGWPSL
ncbi:hypothetical protein GCM10027570_29200 [Streptomonospora sediminis]